MDGALKIRLQAPAVENRANQELCAFLAELLKRPKSAVRILSGERSRNKRVEIQGVPRRRSELCRSVTPNSQRGAVSDFVRTNPGSNWSTRQNMNFQLSEIQSDLRAAKIDGWLFYDFRGRDPIAHRILALPSAMRTRRWFYL